MIPRSKQAVADVKTDKAHGSGDKKFHVSALIIRDLVALGILHASWLLRIIKSLVKGVITINSSKKGYEYDDS